MVNGELGVSGGVCRLCQAKAPASRVTPSGGRAGKQAGMAGLSVPSLCLQDPIVWWWMGNQGWVMGDVGSARLRPPPYQLPHVQRATHCRVRASKQADLLVPTPDNRIQLLDGEQETSVGWQWGAGPNCWQPERWPWSQTRFGTIPVHEFCALDL